MFEKTVKVKAWTPAELAAHRHDADTGRDRAAWNRSILERRRSFLPPSVPELVQPSTFTGYVRRLERTLKTLDAPVGDAPAAPGGAELRPLGNNTESHSVFHEVRDDKTGEIQRLRVVSRRGENVLETYSEFAAINARAARYSAQSSAARLLHDERTPRGTQWRVTGCTRRRVAAEVSILYSAAIKKAHFGGLMVCGSVWTCPPCAAKVSERRKNEVVAATDLHKSQGGGLYLVTFTCSHKRDDDLGVWLAKFSAAKVKMRQWRAYLELKADLGYVGDIRSLEVTYGDANGWHPHEHGLWLTAGVLTVRKLEHMRAELFKLWRRACVSAGLPPPNRKRGVDVRFMESSAEYVAKFGREPRWGAGSEMAKQHSKVGKVLSMTPFDLLRRYHDGSADGSHKRFGALFVQFAKCFFGKRQIIWSRGLKQLFGIVELTDEEVAVVEAEDAREVLRISPIQWRCVLHQKHDVRQILLERAETGGYQAASEYLDDLMSRFIPF